ncbi:putative cuticle protein 7 [Penaeus vannamei]|uniref:Putative cuticle protein 7 n=1 Tax=Penaeus vannamei TaxID=6689 RepID=A0A3R7LTJ7_PENVA|nr:putative cuticle protein 7 [Penaeus vannamei]
MKGMPYGFDYAVNDQYTGTDFSQTESSDGNVVTGEYRVLLPDGRTQIVTYTADHENGFVADVRYEGEAQYPQGSNGGGYGGQQDSGYGGQQDSGYGGQQQWI